ncbi:MAG TPA: D-glycero-beta-D-manno-heptose 1-phosphate adenylyltransferase [Pirellulales bacterium]|jgi:D-beta-D-heptose 7-phosphate kinase/D-beta-D-heptose 1-phosphate adenosyltransferase|nr:D-glycero-beta-D-manno-heptose 1-phosphate adenylyltransferase [Pirellulales bacterium]
MNSTDLIAAFERLRRPRVLVLGDLILDRYTWGEAERISQEAPVIVLRADQRESRLGGAGNVCQMLRGLEAEVTCLGMIGDDADGQSLASLLDEWQVNRESLLVDAGRPTTSKERFIGRAQGRHPHQILRVDCEQREPLDGQLQLQLIARLPELVRQHDIALISDYDKGVCTPEVLRATIDAGRAAGVSVLVDPIRGTDYSRYRGATTMTPNRTEAGLATGIKITTIDEAYQAGRKLCRDLDLKMAIITLDRDGMALVHADGRAAAFATQPRAVYDITGAGDMVLAMIGVALASELAAEDAVRLGNVAGGLEVEKVGVAVIPRSEIRARLLADLPQQSNKLVDLEPLALLVEAHRAAGQRIVLTNGCFDLLHVGHIHYLQEAARLGDVLVVGLNDDASVQRLKGPGRPVISQRQRAAILAALGCVNYVVMFGDDTPLALLERLKPDVLVKGGTYAPDEVVGHEFVESYGGQVHVTRLVEGISSSGLLASFRQSGTPETD